MGSARNLLRDDGVMGRVVVELDEDPPLVSDLPGEHYEPPTVRVYQRRHRQVDDDGNYGWRWDTVVEGPAYDWEDRSGVDPTAGTSGIVAIVTIAYDGSDADVTESARVKNLDTGRRYGVTKVETPTPGYLRLHLRSGEQR